MHRSFSLWLSFHALFAVNACRRHWSPRNRFYACHSRHLAFASSRFASPLLLHQLTAEAWTERAQWRTYPLFSVHSVHRLNLTLFNYWSKRVLNIGKNHGCSIRWYIWATHRYIIIGLLRCVVTIIGRKWEGKREKEGGKKKERQGEGGDSGKHPRFFTWIDAYGRRGVINNIGCRGKFVSHT